MGAIHKFARDKVILSMFSLSRCIGNIYAFTEDNHMQRTHQMVAGLWQEAMMEIVIPLTILTQH